MTIGASGANAQAAGAAATRSAVPGQVLSSSAMGGGMYLSATLDAESEADRPADNGYAARYTGRAKRPLGRGCTVWAARLARKSEGATPW